MAKDYGKDKQDFFDTKPNPTLVEVDEKLYGAVEGGQAVDIPASGKMIAKPLPLENIRINITQPRRGIPGLIRVNFNGDPAMVMDLLNRWQLVAEQKAGKTIPVVDILKARRGFDLPEKAHPYLSKFIELLELAQSIHTDGLDNPPSVVKHGADYLIESGERRYLAHHLLAHYIDKQYAKMPAIEKDSLSVFRQASENMHRNDINAIAKARQLALLVMDVRRHLTDYDDYEDAVVECDWDFYRQVANTERHKIPDGDAERIYNAMRVRKTSVSNFRKILEMFEADHEVSKILWMRADDEDWSIQSLLRILSLPLDTVRSITAQVDFTLKDLEDAYERFNALNSSDSHNSDDDDEKPTPPPKESLKIGDVIQHESGSFWLIEEILYNGDAFTVIAPSGFRQQVPYHKIVALANDKRDLFHARPQRQLPTGADNTGTVGQGGSRPNFSGTPAAEWLHKWADLAGQTVSVIKITAKDRVIVREPNGKENEVNISALQEWKSKLPRSSDWMKKRVKTKDGHTGKVVELQGRHIIVAYDKNAMRQAHNMDDLTLLPDNTQDEKAATFTPTAEEKATIGEFYDGERVRLSRDITGHAKGTEGEVNVSDNGERSVLFDGDRYYSERTVIDGKPSHVLLWCELVEEDEGESWTTYTDEVETGDAVDGAIFDEQTLEFLEGLSAAADVLDIIEAFAFEDLLHLDETKLRNVIIEGGAPAVDQLIANYSTAVQSAFLKFKEHIDVRLSAIHVKALEMAKDDS